MFKKIGILGFGRFGALLADLLKDDFDILVFDPAQTSIKLNNPKIQFAPLEVVLSTDALFYCVPISTLEGVVKAHVELLYTHRPRVIFDVLSVKVHPKNIFNKYLPTGFEIGLTHPMFGPDSVKVNGLTGLPFVFDRFKLSDNNYLFWKNYFETKTLHVIEMSAEEHDRKAAYSQGLAHFVGRILGELDLHESDIDTLGAKKLHEIKSQVCNDSWQLFLDLQSYNPSTLEMRIDLGRAQSKIYNALLPNRINKEKFIVGIQGGRGSFNEEAALYYLRRSGIEEFELVYLHTTENVLKALNEGQVDRGQFAIHNSLGGIVDESIVAMSRYTFNIIEEFGIKIAHSLMIHPDAQLATIESIMTHPQVLRQCSRNLAEKYSKISQTSGEGELIDHAKVAEFISEKKLPLHIATMGSKRLAEVYGLKIIEDNLQDLQDNFTSFMWVERPVA